MFAAVVLGQMLNMKNSKFQQRLVETNLFYECNVRSTFSRYTSSFYVEAYPNEKKVAKAMHKLDEEIEQWAAVDYFTIEELESAINLIHINEAYFQEELSEYIHELSYRWSSGDMLRPEEYLNQIDKVSLIDIQKLIRKYIANQSLSAGFIIPPSQRKQVSKMGWEIEN